jgi:hypothetical protein
VIVDWNEFPAGAAMVAVSSAVAGDAVADLIEPAKFFDVDVNRLARMFALVAPQRLGLSIFILSRDYCPSCALSFSWISRFIASRLKVAGACIGGNSIAVSASSATFCWTRTKRQNSRAKKSIV